MPAAGLLGGLGLGIAGGWMQYDAAQERQAAMEGVNRQYANALTTRQGQVDASNLANVKRQYADAGQNLANIGQGVQDFQKVGDPQQQDTAGFLANIGKTQAGMPKAQALTPEQGAWGQAAAQQTAAIPVAHLGNLSAQWQARQAEMLRAATQTEQKIRQLVLLRNQTAAGERAAIDQQIQALAWQRTQQQLQLDANRAQQTGGEKAAYGGMLGGLSSLAGLANMGGGEKPANEPTGTDL